MNHRRIWFLTTILLPFVFVLLPSSATAQAPRDYMTDEEIELVREAQDIDLRIDVLTRMIDRRFATLKIDVGGQVVPSKDSSKWGAAPSGTKAELLGDIKKLLEKAIDDIDNVAAHPVDYSVDKDRSEKQKKKDAQRFPSAVRNLAVAARRYQPALKTLAEKATDEREKGLALASLEFCDEIVSASAKLSAETGN